MVTRNLALVIFHSPFLALTKKITILHKCISFFLSSIVFIPPIIVALLQVEESASEPRSSSIPIGELESGQERRSGDDSAYHRRKQRDRPGDR